MTSHEVNLKNLFVLTERFVVKATICVLSSLSDIFIIHISISKSYRINKN